jgi:hypothetical protein
MIAHDGRRFRDVEDEACDIVECLAAMASLLSTIANPVPFHGLLKRAQPRSWSIRV